MADFIFTKPQWRAEIKKRLGALTNHDYQIDNQQIEAAFLGLEPIRNSTTILIYYSVRREVMTVGLITQLLALGKQVALPVCTPEYNLEARLITNICEVEDTGNFGLKEPIGAAPSIAVDQLDLIVVPGMAFDRGGNRLGHGKGYYDRFLGSTGFRAYKLGLAYDFQVVEQLPVDRYDLKMNALLTPSTFYQWIETK